MHQIGHGIWSGVKVIGFQGERSDLSHVAIVRDDLLLHERIGGSSCRVQLLQELGVILLLHVVLELAGTQRLLEAALIAEADRGSVHLG